MEVVNVDHFREDDRYIYLEDNYMEFYIPTEFFSPTKRYAEEFKDYITSFGIFNVGLFKNGKLEKIMLMNNPYPVKIYVYDMEDRVVDIPGEGEVPCRVLKFLKGAKVMDVLIVEDSINAVNYLDIICAAKVPKSVPYDEALSVWHKNQEISGANFGIRAEVEEIVLALSYRNKNNLSEKFAKQWGSGVDVTPYDYDVADIRKICQYASTFSAITFEDIDTMITTSINRARTRSKEAYSPLEDTIKM